MDAKAELYKAGVLPSYFLYHSVNNPTGALHYIWDASLLSSIGTVQGTKNDGDQVNSWNITAPSVNAYRQGLGQIAPFAQGTAANCPLLRLSGVNGNSYLEFNGVNHRLFSLFYNLYARDFNYSTFQREWIVVCKFRSPDQGGMIVGNYRNIAGAEFFYMWRSSGVSVAPDNPNSLRNGVAHNNANNWPDNIFNSPAGSFPIDQMTLCSYQLGGDAKLRPRVNGAVAINPTASNISTELPNSSNIYLGATESANAFANMDLYYMAITSGNISDVTRQNLMRHLSARFSTPLSGTIT